jgi:hypothetical protein
LEVVLPEGAPAEDAATVLRDQSAWLDDHATDIHRAQRSVPMQTGARLPIRGNWARLEVVPGRRHQVSYADGRLRVVSPTPDDADAIRSRLERWYRAQARAVVSARVDSLRLPNDGPVNRVTIRDQATCWASCSGRRMLSFNWRLVMTPSDVLDSVVTHELVHLRIADHSSDFWSTLDERFPRHGACRRWLNANAYRLGL